MSRLFGTDGVRGIAGSELTPLLAFKLGQAGAHVLAKKVTGVPQILVGKDTRISGDMLEAALIAGICSVGANAVSIGVLPTPAIAYLTKKYGADAGVVISASHNPAKYNGIKFFSGNGLKLPDDTEDEIERVMESDEIILKTGEEVGRCLEAPSALMHYVEFAQETIDCNLEGLKIAVDCANGAAFKTAPICLERLGAEILVINNEPDGYNINKSCGSTHIEGLSKFVVQNKCDLGIAFDGDADRVLAIDNEGTLIDGDQIMAVCAAQLKKEGRLKNNTLVATVMSNMGLFIMGEKIGINVLKTKVGDRYVLEEMLLGGHVIGGEQSGHIIFTEYTTTGDGLISALKFLEILKKTGKTAKELASIMTILPQALINAKVSNENKELFESDPVISAEIIRIEELFKGNGRVLIRPSGTEPKVRVMMEGPDLALLQKEATALAALIEKRLA